MKAEELRLGNFVMWNRSRTRCFTIKEHHFRVADMFKPVPLTEERLIKLGFTTTGQGYFFHSKLGCCYLSRPYKEADGWHVKSNGQDKLTYIKYVHHIQNLFYILTGEELT